MKLCEWNSHKFSGGGGNILLLFLTSSVLPTVHNRRLLIAAIWCFNFHKYSPHDLALIQSEQSEHYNKLIEFAHASCAPDCVSCLSRFSASVGSTMLVRHAWSIRYRVCREQRRSRRDVSPERRSGKWCSTVYSTPLNTQFYTGFQFEGCSVHNPLRSPSNWREFHPVSACHITLMQLHRNP